MLENPDFGYIGGLTRPAKSSISVQGGSMLYIPTGGRHEETQNCCGTLKGKANSDAIF